MNITLDQEVSFIDDPLVLGETLSQQNDWNYQRLCDSELIIYIDGQWGIYRVHLLWQKDLDLLYFVCFSNIDPVKDLPSEIYKTLSLCNQKLWMGHFNLQNHQEITYRHTIPLRGTHSGMAMEQFEDVIHCAIGEFDFFYPEFHNIIHQGSDIQMNIDSNFMNVFGEA